MGAGGDGFEAGGCCWLAGAAAAGAADEEVQVGDLGSKGESFLCTIYKLQPKI